MRKHPNRTRAGIVLLALVLGCPSPKENPLADVSIRELGISIQTFEMYAEQWEKRVSSGEWDKMLADGSWVKLVPGDKQVGVNPKTYPAERITEFKAAAEKARAEIDRRK